MLENTVQTTSDARTTSAAELLPIAKSSLEACCPECAGDEPCC